MVLMRGNKRVFETPNVETSNSGDIRTVSIYGITSYNDIINCIISIKSKADGYSGTNTLNINNLGAKNIMIFKNGNKSSLDDNWISTNQIYKIYYDGTDFILLNNYNDSSSFQQTIFKYDVNLNLLVVGSYTIEQMDAILDSNFFSYIGEYGLILHDTSNGNKIYEVLNNSSVYDSVNDTNTFKFTILDDNNILKTYTIVLDFNVQTYTVTINTIDLTLRNVNNTYY